MFKNLTVYKIKLDLNKEELETALTPHKFQPMQSLEVSSHGWVPPLPYGDLIHGVSGQYLLKHRTENKLLPASVVKDATAKKVKEVAEQQGFKPGRKQVKEIQEMVRDTLLPKAFTTSKETYVWIDTVNGWLGIDTSSSVKVDEILGLLYRVETGISIERWTTNIRADVAMTNWLTEDYAPEIFTIDQEARLAMSNTSVKYTNHDLTSDNIKQHVSEGKLCVSLGLTYDEKISFVLEDSLVIKKIKLLDVTGDSQDYADATEKLDSELVLIAGELNSLLTSLGNALNSAD